MYKYTYIYIYIYMYVCMYKINCVLSRTLGNKIPKMKIISNKDKNNFDSRFIGELKSTISDESDESSTKYIGSFFCLQKILI